MPVFRSTSSFRLAAAACILSLLLSLPGLAGSLVLAPEDIQGVEFGIRQSVLGDPPVSLSAYNLRLQNGVYTDGQVKLQPSALKPLLNTLRYLFPGTLPLTWLDWTDDYPNAWVTLKLKDGRQVKLLSNNQFQSMLPWNVQVWGTQSEFRPLETYTILNPDIITGLNALWEGVGAWRFPRTGDEPFLTEILNDPLKKTVTFYITKNNDGFRDAADQVPIRGMNSAALAPFWPLLQKDPEIKTLLDSGYRPYDAALSMEVRLSDMQPVNYSGTLALAAPDGGDVVAGKVFLPTAPDEPSTSSFNAGEVVKLVAARREIPFLNQAAQLLRRLTFIIETRPGMNLPWLNCPENGADLAQAGPSYQAIWEAANPRWVTFYPLANNRWTVDFGLKRSDGNWNDALAERILQSWFPEPFASLPPAELQAFHTTWRMEFQPGVTLQQPELLASLQQGQPAEFKAHPQNPEKEGDYGFVGFAGRLSIADDGSPARLLYCGVELPSYYPEPYDIAGVTVPDETAARQGISVPYNASAPWQFLSGSLPWGNQGIFSADLAFSQPGFLHVIWSEENGGVYYSDGWLNGAGWLKKQRLAEQAWWVIARAFPDGEVHLFWDAGLTTGGVIHLWKAAGGEWQKPEHWPEVNYLTAILRDGQGVLHLGDSESDGLDAEFMHRTWSASAGLSAPENISRHTGDIGNAQMLFRLDAQGNLHAAWTHILDAQAAPDPITGESSDLSGVFYAVRDPAGFWSAPELVGVQARYAHSLTFELDRQGWPVVVWQAAEGLVSRFKRGGMWEKTRLVAVIQSPAAPADFGPGRQVQQTAEIASALNRQGNILLGWSVPRGGIRLAAWNDAGWQAPVEILDPLMSKMLPESAAILRMAVDPQGTVTFVFFQDDSDTSSGNRKELYSASYSQGKTAVWPLDIFYSFYGYPEARLVIDADGGAAVMGLPRSPQFTAKLGPGGLFVPTAAPTGTPTQAVPPAVESQVTPTAQASPTLTPMEVRTPTRTAAPLASTPAAASTAAAALAKPDRGANGLIPAALGLLLVVLLGLLGQAWKRGTAPD